MGLARLWRDQGKRREARDLLATVYGWFSEGLDTPVLHCEEITLSAWRQSAGSGRTWPSGNES
jgi:hypothetical protein